MYERCLNEAERILAADRDIIVPVKKVWTEVKKQGEDQNFAVPSLADLTAMMEADSRFEFMATPDQLREGLESDASDASDLEESELENLGFYAGDKVKLRRIELSPEIIGDVIRRKVDLTMEALAKAWELRPAGDQETEDQLLEILSRTQKLQREIKENFSEEKMQALGSVIKKEVKKTSPPARKSGKKSRFPKAKGKPRGGTRRKRNATKGRRK